MTALLPNLSKYRAELDRALAYTGGLSDFSDIEKGLASGEFLAWEGERSVVITQLVEAHGIKELYFFLAAGDLDELKDMQPLIIQWGKDKGCTRASFMGRLGWGRTFLTKQDGWAPTLQVFEKQL